MAIPETDRIAALEKQRYTLIGINALLLILITCAGLGRPVTVGAQNEKTLTVSGISIVDNHGVVRARLAGNLPDAVINGKLVPRGSQTAGLLPYDDTGEERSGYLTFSPSGNVGLTLDNRKGQTAEFVAGPSAGAALRLHYQNDAVELRADEDGPSIHAVQNKEVAFHAPDVQNPKSTSLCKALADAKKSLTSDQLLDACRARTSEAACKVCLAN
jgi:hypothetical protein